MEKPTILVTVPKKGLAMGHKPIKIEGIGFVGEGCSTEIGKLKIGQVISDLPKAEFYESPTDGTEHISQEYT